MFKIRIQQRENIELLNIVEHIVEHLILSMLQVVL